MYDADYVCTMLSTGYVCTAPTMYAWSVWLRAADRNSWGFSSFVCSACYTHLHISNIDIMGYAPPYLSSQESNASSVLEQYPPNPEVFVDKLRVVRAKIGNNDALTQVLLKYTIHHLGISEGIWRMICCMDGATSSSSQRTSIPQFSFPISFNYFYSRFDPKHLVRRVGGKTPAQTGFARRRRLRHCLPNSLSLAGWSPTTTISWPRCWIRRSRRRRAGPVPWTMLAR